MRQKISKKFAKIKPNNSKIFRTQHLENQVTEDMADNQIEGWLKLGKLQQQVTEKYPNVQVSKKLLELDHLHCCHPGSSILTSVSNFENFQTELSTDRLMVEDRIVTWDPKSSKLVASSLIFLPRKSKSR